MLLTLRPVRRKVAADVRRPDSKESSEPALPAASTSSARLASDEELTKLLRDLIFVDYVGHVGQAVRVK